AISRAVLAAEDAAAPEWKRLPPEPVQSEAPLAPTHTGATFAPIHTEVAFAPPHTGATFAPTHTEAAFPPPHTAATFAPTHPGVGAAKAVPRKSVRTVAPCAENARLDSPEMKPAVFDSIDEEPIEEIDPVDYLEAEVRKVDQSLARELMGGDKSATVFSHIVTITTDLLAIAISSVPFLALIAIIN